MVCIVIVLMLLYTFVGIYTGFGGGSTTMPLVTSILPIKMVTPLSIVVDTATALHAAWLSCRETDWRSVMVLTIFSSLGIPVSLYALSYSPDHFMRAGLNGFLVLYSSYNMLIPRLSIYDRSWIAALIGAMVGALGAAFPVNGPPMVTYGMLRNLGPVIPRGILNTLFTANNIMVISGLTASGILTISIFKLVLFCTSTTVPGSLVGRYTHKHILVKAFHVTVFLLLIVFDSTSIKGALGIPAAAALLPLFTLLVILQLALGKKVAVVRRVGESK